MPTKRLPSRPHIEQLKHQARDLQRSYQAGELQARQRVREFHPRGADARDNAIGAERFTLSDAQLTIAREYGFASWPRLSSHIRTGDPSMLERPHHERIEDPVFRRAVNLIDDGDADQLRSHLANNPSVVTQRVMFEGGNYFRNPTLLEFVAENPVRHDGLPPNIVEIARTILEAGGRFDQSSVDSTLELVSSGRVTRECGAQIPLISLLCGHGADPNAALPSALVHGEWSAVHALIARGAQVDLAAAAATGRSEDVQAALPTADAALRHRALALAAQHGHADVVRILLDAGEDPNRYNPEGTHSHSTPLHQAALAGHADVVRLLVERGARIDIKDIHYDGTPVQWASHAGHVEIVRYLSSRSS